ncbi:MAG: O-antigen ligase family protein [Longimicrobiales bacterium]|nr:O-antigen ligase family protein [Longimicrobiales bacterium]
MSEAARRAGRISLPRDPFRGALFILTVLTISRVHQHFGLDGLRPGLLLAGFAILYAFMNPRALTQANLRGWEAKAILAMAVIACVSIPFSLSIGGSASYFIDNYSRVLLLALLLLLALRNTRDIYLFVLAYVVGSAILVWLAIAVFDLSSAGSAVSRLDDMYGYDANDAGLVLVMGIPLTLLVLQTAVGWWKFLPIAVLAGSGWAIALTGSRGAFLALGAIVLALLVGMKSIPPARRVAVLLVLMGALHLSAPDGYWTQMSTILTPDEDYNWNAAIGRVAIAQRGLGYMMDHPVTGVGLNNFARAEGTISVIARRSVAGTNIPWVAPHNSYIQVAAELGIPGILVFGTLVFGGMGTLLHLRCRIPRSWEEGVPEERFLRRATLYLPVTYLGFAVAAAFLSFAYLDPIYLLTTLTAAVRITSLRRLRRARPAPAREAVRHRIPGMRGGMAIGTYADG